MSTKSQTMLFAALLCAATAPGAAAQCSHPGYCVDFRALSAVLGYGAARITNIGVPDRVMRGVNARIDVHIVSLVLRRLPIRTYDALIGDVTYGRRTSDSLHGLFPGDVEGTNGFQATFGYQFLAGAKIAGPVALLGGLGWEERYTDIGGTTLSASSTPVIARLEVGERKRIVVTAWHAVGGDASDGARIDVPFFHRLNLTGMYWRTDGVADVWSSPSNTKVPGRGRLLVLGVRTREM